MPAIARRAVTVGEATVSALARGTGEHVVLLHGIPTGAELWRAVIAALADAGFSAVAPDLPGYGETRMPRAGDHSLAGAATLLAQWLEEEYLAPAWIVGHDAGGGVAQILAARHPSVVSRLTLTNSIADGFWPAPRARFARVAAALGLFRTAAAARLVPNAYLRREIGRGFADPGVLEQVDADGVFWNGKFRTRDGRAAFERHLAALSARDTADIVTDLRRTRLPVQLVWGTADPFQPWQGPGRRLQALLRNASVTLLDDCGHFPPLECPGRLSAAMVVWRNQAPA